MFFFLLTKQPKKNIFNPGIDYWGGPSFHKTSKMPTFPRHSTNILKVHCHDIQWFYVDFCGRKWRRGDSRPRRRPTRSRPLPHFFSFTSFELRDQSTSGYQSVILAKSFLSRTKMGFELRSRKWKQKTSLPMKIGVNSWKPTLACGAPRIDLELSRFCLGPKIVQSSRGFQVQLRRFRYTVQCTLR